MSEVPFFVTGGTLRQDAQSYVARVADTALLEHLRQGEFCYVLTSRQMGKSSLMVRTALQLRAEGAAVVVLDLTRIGQNLEVEQWYFSMLTHVGEQVKIEQELEDYWDAHERDAPLDRFMGAIHDVYLSHKRKPLVIFVDEIDYVRSLQKFSADEFFAGIRECYNRRTQDPKLRRLTFCLLGVATPSDLIRDQRMTPFNIGRGIELHDFSPAEAAVLAEGLSPHRETAQALLERILSWTSGHPYLTQKLCAEAVKASAFDVAAIDNVCRENFLSAQARERDDNLHFVRERLLHSTIDRAALLDAYAKVCRRERVEDDHLNPVINELRLSGIVRVVDGLLKVRNQIYARVFDLRWSRDNLPDAEQRRQKAAFQRGVRRVVGAALAVLAAMGVSVFVAFNAAKTAEEAKKGAEREMHRAEKAMHETEQASRREAEANRNLLAEAERTKVATQKLEIALSQLEADNARTEKLLGKLVPLIGDRYEPLLELAGDFAQEMPTANLDPRIQIGQAGLRAVRSKLYTKLGDSKKAVHLAEEARQIVERLLRGAPESQPLKLRLYELHYVIGDAFLGSRVSQADNSERRNAEEQALTAYRLARDFAGAAATATPDLPGWRTREFTAWMNLADLLARVGQTEKAFATYAEAEQRIRQRLADDPKDRTLRLALATLKDRVGTLHMSRGQTDRAHPAFEEAFSIRKEGLGDMLPEDIEGQKDIAVSFNKLGNVHLATEQWADALRFHRQSLVIREQLVKQEPTPEGLRNYSYSLNNVAKAYRGLKQEAKAVEYHG
ncbi:MAG: hypothetical protein JWQ44_2506, partial [Chthoniobacter sp.]|nr:hypothetical protein [Chthoniobacter sp.]